MMEISQAAPKFQDVSIAPMHTAEHLLNSQMVKYFHCERSFSAHIEKRNPNVITTSKRHLLPKTLPPWSKR